MKFLGFSRTVYFVLAFIASGAATPAAFAGSRPVWKGPSVLVPMKLDGIEKGEAWIFPSADPSTFMIEAGSMVQGLLDIAEPQIIQKIKENTLPKVNLIRGSSLRDAGIEWKFDEEALELEIVLPAHLRKNSQIDLSSRSGPGRSVLGPAQFSGYLNLRGSEGIGWGDRPIETRGRGPSLLGSDLVMNWKGIALDTGLDYAEKAPQALNRRDSRLVYDDQKDLVRMTFGDLQPILRGYQLSEPQGGLMVSREFAIDPYRVVQPVSRSQVMIQRPSIVEISINGILLSRLHLAPGPFDFKDYPFLAGVNSVEIKITDELGRIETIHIDYLSDYELLAQGLQQFSYSFGAPSHPKNWNRSYETEKSILTLYHRVGITDRWTLGANYQMDPLEKVAGLESGWMTSMGFFSADLAASGNRGKPAGAAAKLQLRTLDRVAGMEIPFRVIASSELKTPDFSQITVDSPRNPYSWAHDIYAVRSLPWELFAGVGLRFEKGRWQDPNRKTWRGDLTKNWGTQWRTSVDFTDIQSGDSLNEKRFLFTLSWIDSVGQTSANLTHETSSESTRLDVSRSAVRPYQDFRAALNVDRTPHLQEANVEGEYLGHRGTIRLAQLSSRAASDSGFSQTSTLSGGTAIAWAGGKVAATRPISDSFIMIDAEGLPENWNLPVNWNGSYSETELGAWGPGVIPSISSYYSKPVLIDDSGISDGALRGNSFNAVPSYHSGVLAQTRVERVVHLKSVLLSMSGKPVSLESGSVRRPGSEAEVQPFFTNSNGEFFIEGLVPAKYELVSLSGKWKPVMVDLSGVKPGLFVAPAVQVEDTSQGARK